MKQSLMNINKTKYRYFLDNYEPFPIRTILTYTVPVPREPAEIDGRLNRDYPAVKISSIKFLKKINDVANSLVAWGVKKGDSVTICQSNTPETYYMDYALSKIGAVANYVYPNITASALTKAIDETDSKFVFMLDDPDIRPIVEMAISNSKNASKIKLVSSSPIEAFPLPFKILASKKQGVKPKYKPYEINWNEFIKIGKGTKAQEVEYVPNQVCSYLRTSGTSSEPKTVMDTSENVNAIVRNYEKDNYLFEKGRRFLQTIPMFVSYGKSPSHVMLCNSIGMILIPEMNPKNFPSLVERFKPDYTFTTPSHGEVMVNDSTVGDLSYLQVLGFGGDGFDQLEDRINSFLKQHNAVNQVGEVTFSCNGYGSTEVSAVAVANGYTSKRHKLKSLGKAVGDVEVGFFVPDTTDRVPEGELGEIAITGDTVTLGYLNDSEETARVYKKHPDGKIWVHMGDLGRIDKDGYIYYEGRLKNVIARKSFKFSPKEIVDSITLHPNVEDCVVVAKYSKEEGQVPCAHITLKDYSNVEKTLNEIIKLVEKNVEEFHWPTTYKIEDKIIKTRNNKNNVMALRIVDLATTYPGVIDVSIENSNDGLNDYKLTVLMTGVVDDDVIEDFDNYVKTIMVHQGIPKSRIAFDIKGVKYSDANEYYKKCANKDLRKKYVKNI